MEQFNEALEVFKVALAAQVQKSYEAFGGTKAVFALEYQNGPKYIRIVRKEPGDEFGSAYGFIEKSTGDVLKAAGWKAPAKNFARGNIFKPECVARFSWTSIS